MIAPYSNGATSVVSAARYPSVISNCAKPDNNPAQIRVPSCQGVGVTQSHRQKTAANAPVPRLYHVTIVTLRSPAAPIWRMLIIDNDQVNTPAITIATAPIGISASTCHGRNITITPISPTTTAVARRGPTRSPSSGTDTMVRNSAITNPREGPAP